jgi:hypothetical protein
MTCLNLSELRELEDAERAFLEDAAEKVEQVILDARQAAIHDGLDLSLAQKGLVTTLIVTTVSFAALYNRTEEQELDRETLAFTLMRCMAEALFDVLGPLQRDSEPSH